MRNHGYSKTPTYKTWVLMRSRCRNPDDPHFKWYGARGIAVCAAWDSSFLTFLADMGLRPAGTSLDRIDNSRGYEPGNCRWATRIEQANNARPPNFTYETRTCVECAAQFEGNPRKRGPWFKDTCSDRCRARRRYRNAKIGVRTHVSPVI